MIEIGALLLAAALVVATDVLVTHLRKKARSPAQGKGDGKGGREGRDTAP